MTSSHSRFTGVLINTIQTIQPIHCSAMHTCIIFYTHFIAICEYPILLLYLFTCFYSWAVPLCFVFAISLSRNAAFEKRLCMNGARDYPNGVYRGPCSLYVICLISSSGLFFFWLGMGEKGQVHWKKDCYLSTGRFLHRIPSRQYFCLTAFVQEHLLKAA